jgi:hypothetical protein
MVWLDSDAMRAAMTRPPPHRSLWRTLIAGAAVIGFAALGAVILYLVTVPLVWWKNDYCLSLRASPDNPAWCYLPFKK